jgi:hypothetical protein
LRPAVAAAPPVNVLLLTAWVMKVDPRLQEQLAAEHINIVQRKISLPLSEEMLRQFHVVVIADWEGPNVTFLPNFVRDDLTTQKNMGRLQQYIQAGGGFLFSPGNGGGSESMSTFLQPYGLRVLKRTIRDAAHAWTTPRPDGGLLTEYAWTTAIAKHPAAEGVSRIFYPTTMLRWDDMYATPAFECLAPAWTALVRGMPTSTVSRGMDYTKWQADDTKAPPIAGVRAFGQGRMGFLAPTMYYTWYKPYDDPKRGWIQEANTGKIAGAFMENGDGKNPSQGRQLMISMLRWLADGARAKGFGEYTEAAFTKLTPPDPEAVPEWLFTWKPGVGGWHQALIGARTAYSDGAGTVADYAAAARTAGVKLLYLTETFEHLDKTKWDAYLADCRKASDATLSVFPGLDIPDEYGDRYLLLNAGILPAANMLTPDGKAMVRTNYLSFGLGHTITVAHRLTSTPLPHQLAKHFQAISIYTYKHGALEDNSLPGYEWEMFRFGNPLPFVVHEIYSPADVAQEAATGHQLYVGGDTLASATWYLGAHGLSHFWESPLKLQITNGPRITAYGGNPYLSVESDEPITDVRLYENYNLYRRWTPNTKTFTVDRVKLPEAHVSWSYLVVTDAKGRTAITPGIGSGKQILHTWRCADRQNWWVFPNIYTGTVVSQFNLRVPTFGTDEGAGGNSLGYVDVKGPQRGDNLAPILDFPYASPAVYVQDVDIDQRYFRAIWDEVGFDARPAHATTRSRVFEAHIRYQQFFTEKPENNYDHLPILKEIILRLRRPVEASGKIFPVITTLDEKLAQVRGDMSYAYTDPATGKPVTGTLKRGEFVDLPKGGHVGGLIAITDGLRVGGDGQVGFPAPEASNGALPTGTTWQASFITVPPAQVETWRSLLGLNGPLPFTLTVNQGKLDSQTYVTEAQAERYSVSGEVTNALDRNLLATLTTGLVNNDKEGFGAPLREYRLPVAVAGVNYNWPAAVIRPGQAPDPIDVFEGKARARLDVTQAGPFYIGNTLVADNPRLRLAVLEWTGNSITLEVHNPTDTAIKTVIHTVPQVRDRFQMQREVEIPAGTTQIIGRAR